jgi:predicted ATP-grasp superfamily ATP-dependent carboligase
MPLPADQRPPLLIVGASTRAAAHSALRGGFNPVCVDYFGDVDLHSAARQVALAESPAGFLPAAETLPPAPWMYTGGLENHSRIIAEISAGRTLLGNGPAQLARIRNPWWLVDQLKNAGLPALDAWPPGQSPPPRDGGWICKPRRSAGGRGIHFWDHAAPAPREPVWFQRRAVGEAYSAQFLASTNSACLLGVTLQLIGLPAVAAPPFAWCGAITASPLDAEWIGTMRAIGECLARNAGLVGLFGCDFLIEGRTPWLTEVNPRYTAAMELLEFQLGHSLVDWHCQACSGTDIRVPNFDGELSNPLARKSGRVSDRNLGKMVLFAERDLIIQDARQRLRPPTDPGLPEIADIPPPGQRIPARHPVCSLFASDQTEAGCRDRLFDAARTFRERFTRHA